MAKIGRNDRCPCGSGKKYKHCCAALQLARPTAAAAPQGMLERAVEAIRQAARKRKQVVNELGVFVLFATRQGNAWLLEVTQSDCVQVARDGEPLTPDISENPETIEVEWSHTFRVAGKQLVLTDYRDQSEQVVEDCPVSAVAAAIKRVARQFPPEVRAELHISPEAASQSSN